VRLSLSFAALSLLPSTLLKQASQGLRAAEAALAALEPELAAGLFDELRYMLSPRYLYRFVLSNIISFLHVWLSFLAFKNDVGFYVGRKDMSGISASSLLTSFVSSVVIFLYLHDSGGTSSVVLLTVFGEIMVDGWKLKKILRPSLAPSFPFVRVYDPAKTSEGESRTASYDAIASKNLWLALLPLLVGCGAYSLQHNEYRSWYSFLVSHASNMVYALGFVRLCPQIYINYR
jgi:hypothetical protein